MATQQQQPIVKDAHPFVRTDFEGLLTRRFFYAPAFEIYQGCAGFYDYGPPGASLMSNILDVWRKHFIVEEDMLEIDTTTITLADVLKTSGHVDKFTDWMVKDAKKGDTIYRADHLVEAVIEARLKGHEQAVAAESGKAAKGDKVEADADKGKDAKKNKVKAAAAKAKLSDEVVKEYENILAQIDNYTGKDLGDIIKKYEIKAPETGNDLTEPVEFNLMFDSNIGPTGHVKGYLRPETAQGHFINFQRLLEFNNGRVPFASAQIGRAYRNEISPRQGLLRVREFVMAEIEHYVDPTKKDHIRFDEVRNVELRLLPKEVQQAGKSDLTTITIGEAVDKGIVDNSTLGYFLARVHLFLLTIGIDPSRLRFRQHMGNEMAHYAADCWDAEILNTYGWIECVGCADRSAYDLSVHAKKTGKNLSVREQLKEPVKVEVVEAKLDKKLLGPRLKGDAKEVERLVGELDQKALEELGDKLEKNGSATITLASGSNVELTKDLISVTKKTVSQSHREYIPNVIEPSFGIGRILFSVLEHAYWCRAESAQRGVLSLPTAVAPIKVLLVPISGNPDFRPLLAKVSAKFRQAGIACRVDDSGASIGKRYARNDELGTPFGVTVDFASVKNNTITLRERDTTSQLIGSVEEVVETVIDLVNGRIDWEAATKKLPAYSGVQDVEDEKKE